MGYESDMGIFHGFHGISWDISRFNGGLMMFNGP